MLNSPRHQYLDLIWEAAGRLGRNAARVTDDVIRRVFPRTSTAADEESAFSLFRNGVLADVKRIIRGQSPDEEQIDFASIHPSFHDLVTKLRSHAYHVSSKDAQVPVHELILMPHLLDEARRYMRQKGVECLEEAGRLDRLYHEVMARRSTP